MGEDVTWERLRSLASFRAERGRAISLYLDLEPQLAPTPGDVATRARSLIDEASREADAIERDLGHAELPGWMHAEAHATPAELLPGTMRVLSELREQRERSTLEQWRQDAGRGTRASVGRAETLEAASDARVDMLLYREGANRPALLCRKCGRAQATGDTCPVDGTELEESADGLDLAVHQTLGTALPVTSRRDLDATDGIGALLRY